MRRALLLLGVPVVLGAGLLLFGADFIAAPGKEDRTNDAVLGASQASSGGVEVGSVQDDSRAPPAASAPGSHSASTTDASSRVAPGTTHPHVSALAGARSYSDFLSRDAQLSGVSGVRLENRIQAAARCKSLVREGWTKRLEAANRVGGAHAESVRHQVDFWKRFCDAEPEAEANIAFLEQQLPDGDDLVRASDLYGLFAEEIELGHNEGLSIIRTTNSGNALLLAKEVMEGNGASTFGLGEDQLQGTRLLQMMPEMRSVAFRMVACELDRNCGPDSMIAWTECAAYNLCRPGISMPEIWQQVYGPEVLRQIREMANRLRRLRAG